MRVEGFLKGLKGLNVEMKEGQKKKPSVTEGFFLFDVDGHFGLWSKNLVTCCCDLECKGMSAFGQFDLYGILVGGLCKLTIDEKMDMVTLWSFMEDVTNQDRVMNGGSAFWRGNLDGCFFGRESRCSDESHGKKCGGYKGSCDHF